VAATDPSGTVLEDCLRVRQSGIRCHSSLSCAGAYDSGFVGLIDTALYAAALYLIFLNASSFLGAMHTQTPLLSLTARLMVPRARLRSRAPPYFSYTRFFPF
jgi:hypothetical protein